MQRRACVGVRFRSKIKGQKTQSDAWKLDVSTKTQQIIFTKINCRVHFGKSIQVNKQFVFQVC